MRAVLADGLKAGWFVALVTKVAAIWKSLPT